MIRPFTSADSGKQYRMFIHEQTGEAVSCSCPSRQFNPDKPCKHMRAHNQPQVLWSEVCGHRVKKDVHQHCGCLA